MGSRRKIVVIFLVVITVGVLVATFLVRRSTSIKNKAFNASIPAGSVVVDVGTTVGTMSWRASGILLTGTQEQYDGSYLIPIKPSIYRTQNPQITDNNNYNRFKNVGARVEFLIYANFFTTDPSNGKWPGDNGDWTAYENSVREAVNLIKTRGFSVDYEVWNEPDITIFWKRDQQRFFETWKRAYQIIKELDSQAKVVGPSIAVFSETYLHDFLTFARANNVLPDVLSWHELDTSLKPTDVTGHISNMKSWISGQGFSVPEISINEIIGPDQTYFPGDSISYFGALEYSNVGGARACWDDSGGVSSCWNYTLDGLLTPDMKPRSVWWAYKSYGDMSGNLVSFTDASDIYGLATSGSDVTILVGKPKNALGTSNIISVVNPQVVPGLVNNGKVKVILQRIPNSGAQVLESLPPTTTSSLSVDGNLVIVNLPDMQGGDGYIIKLVKEENQVMNFKVKLQGINTKGLDKTVSVSVRSGSNIVFSSSNVVVSSDSTGIYSGSISGVPMGTYDIYIKEKTHLGRKFANVSVGSGISSFDWTNLPLKVGDMNSDNVLNIMDIALMLSKYTALSVLVSSDNQIYDVNDDGIINISDIALVLSNYTALQVMGE